MVVKSQSQELALARTRVVSASLAFLLSFLLPCRVAPSLSIFLSLSAVAQTQTNTGRSLQSTKYHRPDIEPGRDSACRCKSRSHCPKRVLNRCAGTSRCRRPLRHRGDRRFCPILADDTARFGNRPPPRQPFRHRQSFCCRFDHKRILTFPIASLSTFALCRRRHTLFNSLYTSPSPGTRLT